MENRFYEPNLEDKLDVDICGIFDPPLKTYNDFSNVDEKWPETVVAKVMLGSLYGEPYKDEYKILK